MGRHLHLGQGLNSSTNTIDYLDPLVDLLAFLLSGSCVVLVITGQHQLASLSGYPCSLLGLGQVLSYYLPGLLLGYGLTHGRPECDLSPACFWHLLLGQVVKHIEAELGLDRHLAELGINLDQLLSVTNTDPDLLGQPLFPQGPATVLYSPEAALQARVIGCPGKLFPGLRQLTAQLEEVLSELLHQCLDPPSASFHHARHLHHQCPLVGHANHQSLPPLSLRQNLARFCLFASQWCLLTLLLPGAASLLLVLLLTHINAGPVLHQGLIEVMAHLIGLRTDPALC